jgi:hypothetical protein
MKLLYVVAGGKLVKVSKKQSVVEQDRQQPKLKILEKV